MRSKGFSLVEVLVASALLSIIIGGVTQMIFFSVKDSQRVKQNLTVTDFENIIRNSITNNNACSNSLAGLTFRGGDSSTYPSVTLYNVAPYIGPYSITNEAGNTQAVTISPSFATNRQFTVPGWSNLVGTINPAGTRIDFSNGSVWTRGTPAPPATFSSVLGIWFFSSDPSAPTSFSGGRGPKVAAVGDYMNSVTVTKLQLAPQSSVTAALPAGRTNITLKLDFEATRRISPTETKVVTNSFDVDASVSTTAAGITTVISCRGERQLASVPSGMCPTGQFATGFDATGAIQCAVPGGVAGGSCPAGQYVSSIDTAGTPVCTALPKPIFCQKAGNVTPVMYTHNQLMFTAAECGGSLPDSTYVGAATQIDVCGGAIGFIVLNAGGGGPGIDWWPSVPPPCTGYSFRAVYVKRTFP